MPSVVCWSTSSECFIKGWEKRHVYGRGRFRIVSILDARAPGADACKPGRYDPPGMAMPNYLRLCRILSEYAATGIRNQRHQLLDEFRSRRTRVANKQEPLGARERDIHQPPLAVQGPPRRSASEFCRRAAAAASFAKTLGNRQLRQCGRRRHLHCIPRKT